MRVRLFSLYDVALVWVSTRQAPRRTLGTRVRLPAEDSRLTVEETARGRDLFIVDNSVSGWTGLRYLEEWTEIAKGFDIATGHFEIGALLALEGKWQKLEKIRILMGAETTHRTRKALLEAVRKRSVEALNASIEDNKDSNPFLKGVPTILEALLSRRIECRVYDKDKFHAKAYITHAKLEVVGSQALVGSSNFSAPGLTKNIELNVQIQSAREVAQLQEWFEAHWNDATDVTETIAETVERHTREYTPFEVYAKALQEFFRGHELTATEWDETRSKMYPRIDRYQKEAYWADEDRPPTRRRVPLRRGRPGQDFCWSDAYRAPRAARRQTSRPVCAEAYQRRRMGAPSARVVAPHRRRGRTRGFQQPGGVQPYRSG